MTNKEFMFSLPSDKLAPVLNSCNHHEWCYRFYYDKEHCSGHECDEGIEEWLDCEMDANIWKQLMPWDEEVG